MDAALARLERAVVDKQTGEYIVKVINTTDSPKDIVLRFEGMKRLHSVGTLTLDCRSYEQDNTLDAPTSIVPQEGSLIPTDNTVRTVIAAKSFVVYRVK